jgi:hypothetical protein
MTRLSKAFGNKYEKKRSELLIRKFELGGHTFRVRIPLVAESDEMYKRITNPDEARVAVLYQTMSEPLLKHKESADEGFQFVEDDILVQGRSLREAAKNKATLEARIVEYVKLLVPEVEGATLDDLTYADIEEEWPLAVQTALVEKIGEVISPGYKEARGN